MNRKVNNRIDMIKAVVSVLNENQAIWVNTPKVVTSVNQLVEGLNFLQEKAALHNSITLGVTRDRKEKYAALAKTMISVQDALWIYGNSTNNFNLVGRNKVVPSTTFNLSLKSRLVRIEVIMKDVETYGAFLADYGVTQEMLGLLNDQIAAYLSIEINPRLAIIERKTTGIEIEQKVNELNKLLKNDLDRMIRIFSTSYPSFVVAYFTARVVIHGHGKTKSKNPKKEPDIGN